MSQSQFRKLTPAGFQDRVTFFVTPPTMIVQVSNLDPVSGSKIRNRAMMHNLNGFRVPADTVMHQGSRQIMHLQGFWVWHTTCLFPDRNLFHKTERAHRFKEDSSARRWVLCTTNSQQQK